MGILDYILGRNGSSKEDLQSQGEYQGDLSRRFGFFQKSLETYGQKVGTGHPRILIPKKALSERNLEDLGFQSVLLAIPESGQKRFSSFRHPDAPYHIHDLGPYWSMHADAYVASTMQMQKEKDKSLRSMIWTTAKGLPHVLSEGVPGLYYYLKGQAMGAEPMLSKLQRDISPEYMRRANALQPIRIPGRDDAYNTIEGLRHGGQAEIKRKELTEFGSGWDPLRKLFKNAAKFEAFTASKGFKAALETGKPVLKEAGGFISAGGFGASQLMETTLKVPRRGFARLLGNTKDVKFKYIQKSLRGKEATMAHVYHETSALRKLGDLNAPTFYGHGKGKSFFMEYMQGQDVREMYLSGQKIPKKAVKNLAAFVKESHKREIAHMDIGRDISYDISKTASVGMGEQVPRNMILTKEGKIGVIDYGMWQPAQMSREQYMSHIPGRESANNGISIGDWLDTHAAEKLHKAKDLDMELVKSLERTGGQMPNAFQTIQAQGRAAMERPSLGEIVFAPTQATPRAREIALERQNVKVQIGANTQVDNAIRKRQQSQLQLATTATMAENARAGGKRSRNTFASTARTLK